MNEGFPHDVGSTDAATRRLFNVSGFSVGPLLVALIVSFANLGIWHWLMNAKGGWWPWVWIAAYAWGTDVAYAPGLFKRLRQRGHGARGAGFWTGLFVLYAPLGLGAIAVGLAWACRYVGLPFGLGIYLGFVLMNVVILDALVLQRRAELA